MAALPPIDYQQLAQTLLANDVAAAGGAAGAGAGGGAAPAASAAAHYGGDHMDIERAESSMKKYFRELRRHKRYGTAKHWKFPGSCV